MDLDGPWSWSLIDAPALRKVRERLGHLERMTFGEIEGHQHHEIPSARLSSEARRRLRDLRLDDFDTVLSLRIGKRERVWGLKSAGGVLLLWWDPRHSVYPVDTTGN